MNMKKVLGAVTAAALAATALVMPTSAADSYKAGLIFQSEGYFHRVNDNLTSDAIGQYGTELDDQGDFVLKDTTINGDGEYVVEVSGLPEDGNGWHFLKIYTDIPVADGINVEVTNVEGEGVTYNSANKSLMEGDPGKDLQVNIVNEYNPDIKDAPVAAFDGVKNIKVTFKVTGLGAGDTTEASTEAPATSEAEGTEAPATTTAAAGDTTKPTDDKNNADTGIEGVAVVAGLAVLAAGAVVVAKKRK